MNFSSYLQRMKSLALTIMLFTAITGFGQGKDQDNILTLLSEQTEAWNRGDIEAFMQTYWNSDSLLFIGKNGVNRGWKSTLNNYKKNYPDTTAMGKLSFDILHVKKLSKKYYYVVGKWMLSRSVGDLSGHFDLLFKKIKGRWYIIADHSS